MLTKLNNSNIYTDSSKFDVRTLQDVSILIAKGTLDYKIKISDSAWSRIERASIYVQKIVKEERRIYGVNTGLGFFAKETVSGEQLLELQQNLIRSHCCGVGEDLPRSIVAGMWLLRLRTFSLGHSGIHPDTVRTIIHLLEHGVLACVPSRGSVGASGDLSPAAHAALILLGEGMCTVPDKGKIERLNASSVLKRFKIHPLTLHPKEGLALINGTQLTTALAIHNVCEAERIWKLAALCAAMSFTALHASTTVLKRPVLMTHSHEGTLEAGYAIGDWLGLGRDGDHKHARPGKRVQDAYCLRCAPQVHGAVWEEIQRSYRVLNDEMNAVTDNPLLFYDDDSVYSCGNFHAIYPARVSDNLASAMTTLASISERRINKAMNGDRTGLPTFLIRDGGLHSGMMMLQVTAAALVSECKSHAHPASVDSIPTNCDKEDHVSMGPVAGFKASEIMKHVRHILAIELLAACQALDFSGLEHCPVKLKNIYERVREVIPHLKQDRVLAEDVKAMMKVISSLEEEGALT